MKNFFVAFGSVIVGISIGVGIMFFVELPALKTVVNIPESTLGAGAHSYSLKQSANQPITSLVATTTIQNIDTDVRVIDKIVYFASTTSAVPTTTITVCYSSTTIGCDTNLGIIGSVGGSVNATQVKLSTTTLANVSTWQPNQYVLCYAATAATSSAGFCAVDYYKD